MTTTTCPQAWHAGLAAGLLVECVHEEKHRGWHRDGKGLSWGGKLTAEEKRTADRLRTAVAS